MPYKYFISIIVAAIFSVTNINPSSAQLAQDNLVKWVIEKNSTLSVEGKSNINSFTCNINEYTGTDSIIVSNDPSKPIKLSGDLQMNVMSFNCHSSLITKDLRKTLNSDEYPKMIIRFLSIQSMPALQGNREDIKGWVEVELAGCTKRFEICYSFSKAGDALIQLNGGHTFCFSDFNLSPPRKLAGLIKIKDNLT